MNVFWLAIPLLFPPTIDSGCFLWTLRQIRCARCLQPQLRTQGSQQAASKSSPSLTNEPVFAQPPPSPSATRWNGENFPAILAVPPGFNRALIRSSTGSSAINGYPYGAHPTGDEVAQDISPISLYSPNIRDFRPFGRLFGREEFLAG